jgi:MFS family permease
VLLALPCESVAFQYLLINVSVRQIAPGFPQSGNNVSWMVTIVSLTGAATLALSGRIADLWGKKRMILVLGTVFLAGSLLCAMTSSWDLFLLGRGLQGTSLGIVFIGFGLVRDIMPRSWVPATIGILAAGVGIAGIAAPLIGGALLDHYSWRSLFWLLAVYMAVVIPPFALVVPESRLRVRARLDAIGAILVGVGAAAVLIYLSDGSGWGWTAGISLGYLAGGIILMALFWLWELKAANPLMDPALLRAPRVSMVLTIEFFGAAALAAPGYVAAYMFETSGRAVKAAIVQGVAASAHLPVALAAKTIRFRGNIGYAHGFSLLQLVMHVLLWTSISVVVAASLGGLWARRAGSRIPLITGMAAITAGTAFLVPWHSAWPQQLAFGLIVGAGQGLFYATAPNLIVDAVPREQQGISAGMLGVSSGLGIAFGTAALTAILVQHPFQVIAISRAGQVVRNTPQVYTSDGFGQVYLIVCVGGGLLALALALALKSGRTPATGGLRQS